MRVRGSWSLRRDQLIGRGFSVNLTFGVINVCVHWAAVAPGGVNYSSGVVINYQLIAPIDDNILTGMFPNESRVLGPSLKFFLELFECHR